MESEKPKSIKSIGIAITALSAMIIFANGMGALVSTLTGLGDGPQSELATQTPMNLILAHYLQMCLTLVAIGIGYLIGGLFIQKHKLWANRLVTVISIGQILIVWVIMLIIREGISETFGIKILAYWPIVVAIFWTVPFALLIWFLNKKNIVKYFN